MNTPHEHREHILLGAMAELKEKASEVIIGIMSGLYTDYLPHVESDTESNICYRATGIVKNLIAGNFKDAGNNLVEVSDDYGCNHYMPLASYERLVKPLCDAMGEQIQSERIKQLEREVESLRNMLNRRSS
jgi:hypothetical protein